MGSRPRRPALLSCERTAWGSPAPYADAAREVFAGRIDLDPASDARANAIVGACHFYDVAANGLVRPWGGAVYCNPPGFLVPAFWVRAVEHALEAGPGSVVIWAGYSVSALGRLETAGLAGDRQEPLRLPSGRPCPGVSSFDHVWIGPSGPVTTRSGRVCWIDPATGEPGRAPSHHCFFALLGGDAEHRARFRLVFGGFGRWVPAVRVPVSRDLMAELLVVLAFGGPATGNGLARRVRARKIDVLAALRRLAQAGRIFRRGHRWSPR